LPGGGDSREPRYYHFTDPQPGNARYYRLRQRDFDGSENLSPVVALPARPEAACAFFPNPLPQGQILNMDHDLGEDVHVALQDVWGRIVWQGKRADWNTKALAPGVYGLQVWEEGRGRFCAIKLVLE